VHNIFQTESYFENRHIDENSSQGVNDRLGDTVPAHVHMHISQWISTVISLIQTMTYFIPAIKKIILRKSARFGEKAICCSVVQQTASAPLWGVTLYWGDENEMKHTHFQNQKHCSYILSVITCIWLKHPIHIHMTHGFFDSWVIMAEGHDSRSLGVLAKSYFFTKNEFFSKNFVFSKIRGWVEMRLGVPRYADQ
jgi:hypothetical protein